MTAPAPALAAAPAPVAPPIAPLDAPPAAPAAVIPAEPPVPPPLAASPTPPAAPTSPIDASAKPDWVAVRTALAEAHPEFGKELERTGDAKALGDRFTDLLKKVRSGELSSREPPKDANPEQMKVWRQQAGVPESAGDYEIPVPAGFKPPETVTAALEGFKKTAHEMNLPAATVKQVTGWYLEQQVAAATARAEQDATFQDEARNQLLEKWGHTEYGRNIAAVQNLFGADEAMFDLVMNGRTADGNVLGNDPRFLSFLLNIGLQANPNLRQYAGDGKMTEGNVVAELKELRKLSMEGSDAYWKDQSKQDRYGKLLEYANARGIKWSD